MFLSLCAASASLAVQPASADLTAEDHARAYMAAYSELDLDAMRAWLNEDTVFVDETYAEDGDPGPHILNGEDAVIALLENFVAELNPIGLNFEWDFVFESNDRVVFSGWVNARYPTENPDEVFQWRARQVTILTVRDGQVVEHRDFANWEAPDEQILPAR